MVTGYVYAKFEKQELTIGQVQVDRAHQGKRLGGLLLEAAEKRARGVGFSFPPRRHEGATLKLAQGFRIGPIPLPTMQLPC